MVMEKECLTCGEKIKGRSDKKFCDDACRNIYNNNLNSDHTNYIRNINNILRKNWRILEELNPQGLINVSKAKLTEKGFNFQYYTSHIKTKAGHEYYYCYDRGYRAIENDYFMLVIRKEN